MATLETREPNFARPVAPHRGRIYLGVGLLTGVVFLGMTIGVQFGLIAPNLTSDVIANLLFGVPVILVPLVILWDAQGENRTRLDMAAELTLFYLPYTACSQIGYELMFLIGHPLGWWTPTTDPGWKWLWWQYALADTRYVSGNPWIFALEVVGWITGVVVFLTWTRLVKVRPALGIADPLPLGRLPRVRGVDEQHRGVLPGRGGRRLRQYRPRRIRPMVQVHRRNIPFMVLPPLVLYAIHLQIDYLTRRAGAQAVDALPASR